MSNFSSSRWRKPQLRVTVEGEGIGHASWIELFFDLVFVNVINELTHYLSEHLSLLGFIQFVALFVPCWWAWVLFTFYIDRYETDDVPHRLLILGVMLATIFLAAAVHEAFGSKAVEFILSYVTIRSLVLLMYLRSVKYVASAWANLRLYLASYVPSTILWIASLWFTSTTRYSLLVLAMAIELAIPIIGSRLLARTPAHPSHLPERFGLLTLIVLGEAIVSVAVKAESTNLSQTLPLLAAIGGFAVAACLWWLYFSFLESIVVIRGIRSVHLYNYGHLPILIGLVTVAVGVDRTIAEISQPVLTVGTRWALCGGTALYMSSIVAIALSACRKRVTILSLIVIAVTLGLAIFGGLLPPIVIEIAIIAILSIKVRADILANTHHHSPLELSDR